MFIYLFIYSLFNDAFSSSDYLGICLEELRKNTKSLSQDSRSSGRDLNLGPPEYNAEVHVTRPRRSVFGVRETEGNRE
jgi:hypothetical protein